MRINDSLPKNQAPSLHPTLYQITPRFGWALATDEDRPASYRRPLGTRVSGPPADGTSALPGIKPPLSCNHGVAGKTLHGASCNALQRCLNSLSDFAANCLIHKEFMFFVKIRKCL